MAHGLQQARTRAAHDRVRGPVRMPTELSFDDHLAGLVGRRRPWRGRAAHRGRAARRRPDVPSVGRARTRRARRHGAPLGHGQPVRGRGDDVGSGVALKGEGTNSPDPVAWWVDGADELVVTLRAVPDDVEAMVFLNDAPPPRRFWARRRVPRSHDPCRGRPRRATGTTADRCGVRHRRRRRARRPRRAARWLFLARQEARRRAHRGTLAVIADDEHAWTDHAQRPGAGHGAQSARATPLPPTTSSRGQPGSGSTSRCGTVATSFEADPATIDWWRTRRASAGADPPHFLSTQQSAATPIGR